MLLGTFLYALFILSDRAAATDHRSRYIVWVMSYMVIGIGVVLMLIGSSAKSARRIFLGVLPFPLAVLMIWFRPQPEYYVLTIDAYHLVPTYTVLAILAGISLVSLFRAITKRSAPSLETELRTDTQKTKSNFSFSPGLALCAVLPVSES
jgi:hypothetical protein